MNLLLIIGRLGRDAIVNDVNGKKVINFTVAVDTGFGDNKTTLWFDCAKWGDKTTVAQYLTKGSQVAVTGEVSLRQYQKNDGTQGAVMSMRVDKLDLVGSKPGTTAAPTPQTTHPDGRPVIEPIDDLPF